MSRLKTLWNRLPRLPRRWRIVRNLIMTAALAVLALELLDWPSLNAYSSFCRLEGAYLLTPSRLVLQAESSWCTGFLTEGDSWITVGSVTKFSSAGNPWNLDRNYPLLHQVLPKEGIVVVLLPAKNEDNDVIAAVWGGPEAAVSGTLELDLMGIADPLHEREIMGLETFSAQAQRREDGWFIFQFVPHDNHLTGTSCAMEMLLWGSPVFHSEQLEQSYRLTLWDAQGAEAASQEGTLPPDQRLSQW